MLQVQLASTAPGVLKTASRTGEGSAEGRSPFAGGTGVSPVSGFSTPFLARKGDGGMVETVSGAPTLATSLTQRHCKLSTRP